MLVPITALYAVILGVIAAALIGPIGPLRLKKQISVLDGGDAELLIAMRRHGNFTEHVPLALILMMIVELNGASGTLLHGVGIVLVLARIAHPLGLKVDDLTAKLRLVGAVGTLLATVALIVQAGIQLL
jgi:hypothetical protein